MAYCFITITTVQIGMFFQRNKIFYLNFTTKHKSLILLPTLDKHRGLCQKVTGHQRKAEEGSSRHNRGKSTGK